MGQYSCYWQTRIMGSKQESNNVEEKSDNISRESTNIEDDLEEFRKGTAQMEDCDKTTPQQKKYQTRMFLRSGIVTNSLVNTVSYLKDKTDDGVLMNPHDINEEKYYKLKIKPFHKL